MWFFIHYKTLAQVLFKSLEHLFVRILSIPNRADEFLAIRTICVKCNVPIVPVSRSMMNFYSSPNLNRIMFTDKSAH